MVRTYYVSLLLLLISVGCAQVVAPTGGEKDTEAPVVVRLEPPNNTVFFDQTTIKIEFDEFVKLRDLNKQLIVSPPLKNKLKTKVKGKTLEIELQDTLYENTTYVLNFGNAIVDLNEGNSIKDFKYAFSTGSILDSLNVNGKVEDSYSHEVEEEFLVMLYEAPINDSTPMKELPKYVGRTNKDGAYEISNIGKGTYFLFGLKDGNNNYLFDRPDEKIAFLNEVLEITESQNEIDLKAFKQKAEKQFIKDQIESSSKLEVLFNLPNKAVSFEGIDTSFNQLLLHLDQNKYKDSLTFWWKEMDDVKLKMRIRADSLFNDTIKFKIDSFPKESKLKLLTELSKTKDYFKPLQLKFDRPISSIDSSKISIQRIDSTAISFNFRLDTLDQKKIFIEFPIVEDSSYIIQLLEGAVYDIYNKKNDSTSAKFTFNKLEDFGKLIVKLNIEDSHRKIIQLTDTKGKMLREMFPENNLIEFKHVKSGSYRLRLIIDSNNDRGWNTGNYLEKKQAERTILFDEDIVIRKNWDKEIEWIIN